MDRIIKTAAEGYLDASLKLVETVFSKWDSPEEGRTVKGLVQEIRSKKYYIPELDLVMVNENDEVTGYVMFSRFHIEGRYEDSLLILTPCAVRTDLQRQGISKQMIEYGFKKAAEMGFRAVLVEGDPKNYVPRGFEPSYRHGIEAGSGLHLPHPDCLMIKELSDGALEDMHGYVDYSFYESLREE